MKTMNMEFLENLLSTLGIDDDLIDIIQLSLVLLEKEDSLPGGYVIQAGDTDEALYALTYGCFYNPTINTIIAPDGVHIVDDVSFNTDGIPKNISIKKMLKAKYKEISQVDALLIGALVLREYTIEIANHIVKTETETETEDESIDFGDSDFLQKLRISRPIDVDDYAQALTDVLGWNIEVEPLDENTFPYLYINDYKRIRGYISPISPAIGDNEDEQFHEMLDMLSGHAIANNEDCLLLCGSGSGISFNGEDNFLHPFSVYFDLETAEWSWICLNAIPLEEQIGKIPVFGEIQEAIQSLPKNFYSDNKLMMRYHKITTKASEAFFEEMMPKMPDLL
jgi:hypothetical protein